MTNLRARQFDLEERTALFAEKVIELSEKLPKNIITKPMISQLIRSATSIGANYREANEASSKKEFRYRIGVCRKEAKETLYWLRLLRKPCSDYIADLNLLSTEAQEFILIFSSAMRTIDQPKN